jgi:hypothetical protein
MDACLSIDMRTIIYINLGSLGSHLDASVPGPRGAWPGALLAPGEKDTGAKHGELGSSAAGLASSVRFFCGFQVWFPGPQNYQKTVEPKGNQWFLGVAPTLQNFRLGNEIYFSKRFHDVDVIALKSHNLLIPDIVKVQ